MRLLPGVLGKPLVGAVGRSLVVERRFSFLFEFVLEVLIKNPKFISSATDRPKISTGQR